MKVKAIRTHKIKIGDNLYQILDKYLPKLKEKDIIAITSKIVSICQGRVVKNDGKVDKKKLIRSEADYYFENELTRRHGITLTLKEKPTSTLIASAGIDESNGNGYFILWPKDAFKTAAEIWLRLRGQYRVNRIGVLIVDSNIVPLRWGTRGLAVGWCGFDGLKDYIGTPDIFGRRLRVTKQNIADDLAAAANLVIGEGNEQTPIAVVSEVSGVSFQYRPPTQKEIGSMRISLEEDIYAPLLTSVKWKRGQASKRSSYSSS